MAFPFKDFKTELIRLGVTNFDFIYDDWVQQGGDSEQSIKDLYWAIYNKLLLTYAQEHADNPNIMYNKQIRVYWQMRMFMVEEGKNPNHIIKTMNNCDLLSAKSLGYKMQVTIIGGNYCSFAKEINGRKFPLDVMLDSPLLPYEKCDRERYCNCVYSCTVANDEE